jgi:hypothetical protein
MGPRNRISGILRARCDPSLGSTRRPLRHAPFLRHFRPRNSRAPERHLGHREKNAARLVLEPRDKLTPLTDTASGPAAAHPRGAEAWVRALDRGAQPTRVTCTVEASEPCRRAVGRRGAAGRARDGSPRRSAPCVYGTRAHAGARRRMPSRNAMFRESESESVAFSLRQ